MVLSLCIPTRNRVALLRKTLDSIVGQPGFISDCELIISDNASEDGTVEMVRGYATQYENIIYDRNPTDIGADGNFMKAVHMATGEYIELLGDKVMLRDGAIERILAMLVRNKPDAACLTNGYRKLPEDELCVCGDFNDFVHMVSYRSTWMSGIIMKRDVYERMPDKARASGSLLIQTDWLLRIASGGGRTLVSNAELLYEQPTRANASYNIFKVFVQTYLGLYRGYLDSGILSPATFDRERKNLLAEFVFPWYMKAIVLKSEKFDTTSANKIIFREFKNVPALYSFPFICIVYLARHCATLLKANLRRTFCRKAD